MLGQNANVAINPATASFPPVHPFPQPTNYLPQFSQMRFLIYELIMHLSSGAPFAITFFTLTFFSSNWESQPSPSALERYLLPTGPIAQLYQIANFGSLNVRSIFFFWIIQISGLRQKKKAKTQAKSRRNSAKWRVEFRRRSDSKMAQSWWSPEKNC